MKRLHTHRARGFSLMEVLIVTSVTLCIAATAIPKITQTLANLELRGGIHSASGILQEGRARAIKDNKSYKVRYTNSSSGGGLVYVDLNGNRTPEASEPQAQMGTTVMAYSAPTSIPALGMTELSYSPVTTARVQFSPTGQPCLNTTTCAVGMVIYFTDTRSVGSPGWAAVSISPAGRVATWVWTGSTWQQ